MKNNMICLDASVFIKVMKQEDDSEMAKDFLTFVLDNEIKLIVPKIFIFEIIETARKFNVPLDKCIDLLEFYKEAALIECDLDKNEIKILSNILLSGNEKEGFPKTFDSAYHAIAISRKGWFLTADLEHKKKTDKFGHICLLKDWKSIFKSENNEEK